jgi:hypothetical protein
MAVVRSSSFRGILVAAPLLAGGFLATAPVLAQAPAYAESDALDQARRLREVAAQKVESGVRAVLRESERLIPADPAKAIERLKTALSQVEDATALSEQRRATLKRLLSDRIRVAAATTAEAAQHTYEQAEKMARVAEPTSEEKAFQLREGIRNWLKENGKPAAQTAADRASAAADRVAENRRLQSERAQRANDALRSVDQTALLPKNDYELPKNWKVRTQNRRGSNDVPLTAKERMILRTLDSPLSVSFKNSRFEDVIDYLQTVTGLPIVVFKTAMEEAGVTYDSPVTLQVKNVSGRSVLRKILSDLGLAYLIKDQTVEVVTPQQAREMMTVRVQYVGDLLFGGALARSIQAAQLIELITSTIDPQSWEVHGGPGKIYYDDLRRSLIIKQSAELQPVLSGGLR